MATRGRRQRGIPRQPASVTPSEDAETIAIGTPSLDSVDSGTQSLATGGTGASGTPSTTADVAFFFTPKEKDPDSRRICLVCQAEYEKLGDPSKWTRGSYSYSQRCSNTTLRGHLERVHRELYIIEANKNGWVNYLSGFKELRKTAVQNNAVRIPFSAEGLVERLVRFIVSDDQSINVVECRAFRDLLLFVRPDMTDEEIPHRTKLRAAIIETWQGSFVQLKAELASAIGRASFTMDIWSSRSRASYLAITAHYLRYTDAEKKEGIEMKGQLIAFHKLGGKHSGVRIANTVRYLLERAGINPATSGHWTCDNASNNGTFIETFIREHRPDLSNPRELLIACFPHVVHLIAGSVIKVLDVEVADYQSAGGDAAAADEDEDGDEDEDEEGTEPAATTRRSKKPTLLGKIRALIRSFRASGQRVEAFERLIHQGNTAGWWRGADGKAVELKFRKLLLDVKTRWDSTYEMLLRLFSMKQPLDNMFLSVHDEFRGLKKYTLSPAEWKKVEQFIAILRHPHRVQHLMAKEKLPVLAGAIAVFETLMTKLEALAEKEADLASAIDAGLATAYKYYRKMDATSAYVVAMFVHPAFRMSYIEDNWEEAYVVKARKTIKELMISYRQKGLVDLPSHSTPTVPKASSSAKTNVGYVNYMVRTQYDSGSEADSEADEAGDTAGNFGQAQAGLTVEQEYSNWVTSPRPTLDVDQLKFWEVNRTQYPTIFRIAVDYLPVQGSSVPAERVFSSSAETDTVRRNRISPILMEALQMLKFSMNHEDSLNFAGPYATTAEELRHINGLEGLGGRDLLGELVSQSRPEERENVMDVVIRAIEY